MTIGSPFGLEQSVATGIVSATSRSQIVNASTDQYGNSTGESTIYPNMIQTDAAINPGNSGGALVDADGKLIGINTLITSYSGNYSGVGFAIPVNYAVNLAQQIIDGKTPTHAQLGVSLSTVNAQNAKRYACPLTKAPTWRPSAKAPARPKPACRRATSSRSSTARTSHPPATSCWTCAPRTRATR